MSIIGQDKLLNKIDSLTLDTLPRTILLCGLKGSGKHTICKYISEKFNLKLLDISEELNLETIENSEQKVEPYLYMIDSDSSKFQEKNQNTILKFIEEPMKNTFIVILCTNKNKLLNTISNRCQVWNMSTYSNEILKQFIDFECDVNKLLRVCKTPGDVREIKSENIDNIFELAEKIIDKIGKATYSNTMTISNKISFKDEKDKIDLNIFSRALLMCAYDRLMLDSDYNYSVYDIVNKFNNDLLISNVDKKRLFEIMLTDLWEVSHGM